MREGASQDAAATKRSNGFSLIPAEIVALFPRMSPRAIALCAALGRWMGSDGQCWPSEREICKALGWTRRSVSYAKKACVAAGAIRVQQRPRNANGDFQSSGICWNHVFTARARACATGGTRACAKSGTSHVQPVAHKHPIERTAHIITPFAGDGSRRAKSKTTNPEVKIFIDWFHTQYRQHMGRDVVLKGGRDGKLVKDLLKAVGLDKLKEAATRMFEDPWGRKHGPDIGLLSGRINKYLRGEDAGKAHRRPQAPQAAAGKYANLKPDAGGNSG